MLNRDWNICFVDGSSGVEYREIVLVAVYFT